MEGYQERVIKERDELQEKYEKLAKFTESDKFDKLDEDNQALLLAQLGSMQSYYMILEMRIKKFNLK